MSKSVYINRNLKCVHRGFVDVYYSFFIALQFVEIGIVTSIEINHKPVEVAKKGQEVCVKIEPIPGESPKMYGRHFEATDILVSKVKAICIFWRGLDIIVACLKWKCYMKPEKQTRNLPSETNRHLKWVCVWHCSAEFFCSLVLRFVVVPLED